jgi:hypothetical protein
MKCGRESDAEMRDIKLMTYSSSPFSDYFASLSALYVFLWSVFFCAEKGILLLASPMSKSFFRFTLLGLEMGFRVSLGY